MAHLALSTLSQVSAGGCPGEAYGVMVVALPVVGIVLMGFVLPIAIASWWIGGER